LLNPARAKINNAPMPAGLNEPNHRSVQSTSKHRQIQPTFSASLTWCEIIPIFWHLSRRKCNVLNNFVTDL
jgi:hypothetical protein